MNDTPSAGSQESVPPASTSAPPQEPRYKGVRGWLLLLCLTLTVFGPAGTLASLAAVWTRSSRYFDQFPGLLALNVIDAFLSLALMTFSLYAGLGLWRIRPGAVQMARRYLLCFLAYWAIAAILPFMTMPDLTWNDATIAQVGYSTAYGVGYFAIWYSYLNKSARVRATYAS